MAVLRERIAWRRPLRTVGAHKPSLTETEQAHVRAAVRFLRVRHGGDAALVRKLGVSLAALRKAMGSGVPSATLALRVAIVAGVNPAEVLDGRWPPPGACPMCGRVTEGA